MKLEILAKVLQDAGLGTIGVSIFVHSIDADTLEGILLRSPLDGIPVTEELPSYYHHDIQVIVRSADQITGDTRAKNVMAALTFKNRTFLNDDASLAMKINRLFPRTLPRVYPTLESLSTEWSIDFDANYVMPSL